MIFRAAVVAVVILGIVSTCVDAFSPIQQPTAARQASSSFLGRQRFSGSPETTARKLQTSRSLLQRALCGTSFNGSQRSITQLRMGLDMVTYLRTEWVSAALCTNQTPRAADVCLQLGCSDGRAVSFIPRTIRNLITSSLEKDGKLSISTRRQLKQQQERRQAATVTYIDQPADNLKETDDESVDVVISLQAAQPMMENGLDWKKSIREAARVLKPGGRLLFVEQMTLNGEDYLDYVESLMTLTGDIPEDEDERHPIFDDVGSDEVDLVLTPHIAGVAIKSMEAGMTPTERAAKEAAAEQARMAELSLTAYERGRKKRKRKRKAAAGMDDDDESS